MSRYILVSLPINISPSNDQEEAVNALRSSVPQDAGTTYPFNIPTFKIGALDALINQADDLSKLCSDCENVVGKVSEALSGLFEGDTERARSQRNIDNSTSHHGSQGPRRERSQKALCFGYIGYAETDNPTIQDPSTNTSKASAGTKSNTAWTSLLPK